MSSLSFCCFVRLSSSLRTIWPDLRPPGLQRLIPLPQRLCLLSYVACQHRQSEWPCCRGDQRKPWVGQVGRRDFVCTANQRSHWRGLLSCLPSQPRGLPTLQRWVRAAGGPYMTFDLLFKKCSFILGPSSAPELILPLGQSASLQCRLLSSVMSGQCGHWRSRVRVTWLDETRVPIEEDSGCRLRQDSLCDATLTLTFQSSGERTFICQVTSGGKVQASIELRIRVLGGWLFFAFFFFLKTQIIYDGNNNNNNNDRLHFYIEPILHLHHIHSTTRVATAAL